MNEQWNSALDQVSDEFLSEAASYHPKRHWLKIVGSMAAALVLVVCWSILRPEPPVVDLPPETTSTNTTGSPTEPDNTPLDEIPQETTAPATDPLPEAPHPIPTLPLPDDPQQIPVLPLPEETTPIPVLPLPEEDNPIPVVPLPEEDNPIPVLPPPEDNTSTVENTPLPNITSGSIVSPHLLILPNLAAAPTSPVQAKCPDPADYPDHYALYDAQQYWRYQLSLQKVKSPDNVRDLDPFMKSAMTQFLSGNGNQVCSPTNIYFALAMLAETSGGNTRQQILDLLGHSNIESLRTQAKQLWQAHYYDNGKTTSLLANSLWLDQDYNFYQNTLNTLATDYFASVFQGDLGSPNMNQQLATWLNSQTGGLLSDYTQNIQLDPATVFCLASTTYFSADWNHSFYESSTQKGIFHCDSYDLNTDFMHKTFTDCQYYYDPIFSAVYLKLADSHTMWLILPDEGYTPADLLKQGNYYQMIVDSKSWSGQGTYKVNLSLPKFDISNELDLTSGLKAMGITNIFNQNADFSPITSAALSVDKISHAARVAIDEEGVIAAAYTLVTLPGAAAPRENEEVDFTLDRPFLFVITGSDNLPLFSGVVSRP